MNCSLEILAFLSVIMITCLESICHRTMHLGNSTGNVMKAQCAVLIFITNVLIAVASSKACMKKVEYNREAGDDSLTVFFSACGQYNACCTPEEQLITDAVIVAPYKEDLAHNHSHFWVTLTHETVMNDSYECKLAYNYTCKTIPNACSNCQCCQEGLSFQAADIRDSPTIADMPDSYRKRNELSEIVGGVSAVTILVLLLLSLPWITKQLLVWLRRRERPPMPAGDPEPGQNDPLINPSPEPPDIVDPPAIPPLGHRYQFVSSSEEESDTSCATGTTAFLVTSTATPPIGNSGDETDIYYPPVSPQPKSMVKRLQALDQGTNEESYEEAGNGIEDPVPNLSDIQGRKESKKEDISNAVTAPPQDLVDAPKDSAEEWGGVPPLLSPPMVEGFDREIQSHVGSAGLTSLISAITAMDAPAELNRNSTNSSPSARSDGSSGSGSRSDESKATGVGSNSDPESTKSHVTGVDSSDDQASEISRVTGQSVSFSASSLDTGQERSSPSSINDSNGDSSPEQCNISDEDGKLHEVSETHSDGRQEAGSSSPSALKGNGKGGISPVSSEDNEAAVVSTTVQHTSKEPEGT